VHVYVYVYVCESDGASLTSGVVPPLPVRQWPEAAPGLRELLLLPTGTGGVLYRPRFLHPLVVFDRRLVNITRTGTHTPHHTTPHSPPTHVASHP